MEFYWAYADYNDLQKFLEKMYKFVIKKTFGVLTLTWQGKKINWGKKWPKVDYSKIFKEKNGFDPTTATEEKLKKRARELHLELDKSLAKGG